MKRRILEVDLSRKKSSPLTELEREAQDRARGVVERADLLKMEREEEIRTLNTVRRAAKDGGDLRLRAAADLRLLVVPAADFRCAVSGNA